MIIWVNGAFGVGKSTMASLVVTLSDHLRLFDPENVGFLLRNNLPDHGVTDFQQLALWRSLVPAVADAITRFTGQTLVAVQTVLNENYWIELRNGFSALGHDVVHVVLDADPDTPRTQIDSDADGADNRAWRHDHVDTFIAARSWLLPAADLIIDTTMAGPTAVAQTLFSQIKRPADSG